MPHFFSSGQFHFGHDVMDRKTNGHQRQSTPEPLRKQEPTSPPVKQPEFRIVESAYRSIMQQIATREPEQGGVLLGLEQDSIITHFEFDNTGHRTSVLYVPDAHRINVLLAKYRDCNLTCLGVVHSHPSGVRRLSAGDLRWARISFENPRNAGNSRILMPLVVDGEFLPFMVTREAVQPAKLVVL